MGGIRLEETTKVYPNGVKAIDDVSLDIHDGEFMVLVGPSGCGKSTLLRMIAGLEEVTEGRILIGDRDVTDLRPRDRDIAMVFQNYALYPQMTVEENLGFGLKLRRVWKAERKSRVDQVAGTLGLKELMGRRPATDFEEYAVVRRATRSTLTCFWASRRRSCWRSSWADPLGALAPSPALRRGCALQQSRGHAHPHLLPSLHPPPTISLTDLGDRLPYTRGMAEPARKSLTAWQEEPDDDPDEGPGITLLRWVERPDGELEQVAMPLTPERFLHSEFGTLWARVHDTAKPPARSPRCWNIVSRRSRTS